MQTQFLIQTEAGFFDLFSGVSIFLIFGQLTFLQDSGTNGLN